MRPQERALACGDVGDGAMRGWAEVVEVRSGLIKIKFESCSVLIFKSG